MATPTKAAAKVAGKLRGAVKALEGYPGIFHHLASEHTEVSTMMKRVKSSSEDSNVRDQLFPEIRKHILAHAHAEEQEFYPPLRGFPELSGLVALCIEDHRRIEENLAALDTANKATQAWTDLFQQLVHSVETHVDREENELFPKAKDLFSETEADDIEDRYEHVEERELAQL